MRCALLTVLACADCSSQKRERERAREREQRREAARTHDAHPRGQGGQSPAPSGRPPQSIPTPQPSGQQNVSTDDLNKLNAQLLRARLRKDAGQIASLERQIADLKSRPSPAPVQTALQGQAVQVSASKCITVHIHFVARSLFFADMKHSLIALSLGLILHFYEYFLFSLSFSLFSAN